MASQKMLAIFAVLLLVCSRADTEVDGKEISTSAKDTTSAARGSTTVAKHSSTASASDTTTARKGSTSAVSTTASVADRTTSSPDGTTTASKGTTARDSTTSAKDTTTAGHGSTSAAKSTASTSSAKDTTTVGHGSTNAAKSTTSPSIAKDTTTVGHGSTSAAKSTTTSVGKDSTTIAGDTTTAADDATTVPQTTTSPPPTHISVLTGELSLIVSDPALFQTNVKVVVALQEAMAELLEIAREQVQILSIAASESAQRRLNDDAEGEVKVHFKITDHSNKVTLQQVTMIESKLPDVANKHLDNQGVKANVASATIPMPTKQTPPTDPCATVATTTPPTVEGPCQVHTTNPCSTVVTAKVAVESTTEAPVKASKLMPWQTKAEIAAASVAGAGAIAGGIAGIVKAEEAKPRVVTVTVIVPVTPAPPALSVKYEESSQKQGIAVAGAMAPQTLVVAMGLLVGCFLIGVSGLVLFRVSRKRQASQIHAFAELSGDESA